MWMLRALWLVVAHDLSEDTYIGDITGNLFFFVLFKTARGFKTLCEFISV